jgi:HEAT repeat protein
MSGQHDVGASLELIFDAERSLRDAHDALAGLAIEQPDVRSELLVAVEGTLKEATALNADEASLRLVCVARVLGELEGPEVVDRLIDVLASDSAEARAEAGEQLQGLGFERFKEVALAVERACSRLPVGSAALVELPYLLIEIPEPGVIKLLGMFLKHDDGDAVGAAIEALVDLGDPSAARLLEPLQSDTRPSAIGDDISEAPPQVTVGELAVEALSILGE